MKLYLLFSLIYLAATSCLHSKIGFKKLVAESQTPKGLNMQVLKELKRVRFYDKFRQSLENVHKCSTY